MHGILSVVMIAGCAAGLAACLAVAGGRAPSQSLPMIIMLAAMADLSIPTVDVLPNIAWCLLLLLLAPWPAAGSRRRGGSMGLHRSLSVLVMFALSVTLLGSAADPSGPGVPGGHAHHGEMAWNPVTGLVVAASGVFVAGSLAITVRPGAGLAAGSASERNVLCHRIEAAAAAVAAAAMAGMGF